MDLETGRFEGYELVDSGGGRKLERFGDVLVDRPCPQAIWLANPSAPWRKAAAIFQRGEGGTGDWITKGPLKESWPARLRDLDFEIRLTGFGNVGLFPEHTCHWDWMNELIKARGEATVLNLFAYTGGATIACALAGAKVVHVDAARSVNTWAMANGVRAGLRDGAARYLGDDAMKFVRREERRGNRYDGIIMDPPTFGRGAKGEVWKIDRDFSDLAKACQGLLSDAPLFALATSHSPGVAPSVLRALLSSWGGSVEAGEMLIVGGGPPLASGVHARWTPGGGLD